MESQQLSNNADENQELGDLSSPLALTTEAWADRKFKELRRKCSSDFFELPLTRLQARGIVSAGP